MEINVKEVRSRLSSLINIVQDGGQITILRRGKEVARIVPPQRNGEKLPHLNNFRASIRISGEPVSDLVSKGRDEERY
ncbi:MAG: type II toxin-antitoxin system prevent-host-death family antitoxin [Desulfatiglandales bacterium]